ncbi:hypothetical protein M5K25_004957 [Dendrobium thyrsiflorum]|uniref:Transposase MuDR plant domain-containing protein n=1 Tax=Dendrobium thyrsiflorum TaxID=117978 RepID=A0ABD0VGF1_DENTH
MEVIVVVKDYEEDMGIAYDSQRVDAHDLSANSRANNDAIADGMSDGFFAAQDLEENSLCVGSRFEDLLCFKEDIRSNAILHNFAIKIKASDKSRVIATCTYLGCPWRIHASLCSDGLTAELSCLKHVNFRLVKFHRGVVWLCGGFYFPRRSSWSWFGYGRQIVDEELSTHPVRRQLVSELIRRNSSSKNIAILQKSTQAPLAK